MNQQMMEPMKIMFPIVASLLRSVKNMVIKYQAKLFPFAKAFFGLRLSGLPLVSYVSGGSGQKRAGNIWDATINSGRLLLIAATCLAIGGCSTALMTARRARQTCTGRDVLCGGSGRVRGTRRIAHRFEDER